MGCRCKERAQIIRRTVQEVRQGNTSNVGRAVAYNVRTLAGDIRNAALSRLTRRP